MTVTAPWTADQVDALNRFQHCKYVHEFTCPADHEGGGDRTLVATRAGWICPHCDYRQGWAHEVMLEEPVNPLHFEDKLHPTHRTRISDASSFDEICILCGATDIAGGGWGRLAFACSASDAKREAFDTARASPGVKSDPGHTPAGHQE